MTTIVELPDGSEVEVETDDLQIAAKAGHTYWGKKTGSAGGLPPLTPLGVPGGTEEVAQPSFAERWGPTLETAGAVASYPSRVIGEGMKGAIKTGREAFGQQPLGPTEETLQRVPDVGPRVPTAFGAAEGATPSISFNLRDIARDAGVGLDVIERSLGAAFAGTVGGAKAALVEAGVSETAAEQLSQDLGTYIAGKGGEVSGTTPVGKPTGMRGMMREFQGKPFEPGAMRPPWSGLSPAEQARWGTEAKYQAATEAMSQQPRIAPPEEVQRPVEAPQPSPFPNAATDDLAGFNVEGMQFAEKPVEAPTLPGLPERPAYRRAGPITTPRPATPERDAHVERIINAQVRDRAAKKQPPMTADELAQLRAEVEAEYDMFRQSEEEMAKMPATPSGREEFTGRPVETPGGLLKEEPSAEVGALADEALAAMEKMGAATDLSATFLENLRSGGRKFTDLFPTKREELTDALEKEAWDAVKKYSDALGTAPAESAKAAQKARAAGLRQQAEGLRARQKAMTDLEKYELAKAEQEIKQKQIEAQKMQKERKKGGFKVIEGGLEKPKAPEEPPVATREPPPDPNSVPPLPPDNYTLPPIIGRPISEPMIIAPNLPTPPGMFYGIVPTVGDLPSHAVPFGTTADLEAKMAKYGETRVKIVTLDPKSLPKTAYTALLSDLPTAEREGHRVSGDSPLGRSHLRAAIDAVKMYRQALLRGDTPNVTQSLLETAANFYQEAQNMGIRVAPTDGAGFSLLNPKAYGARLAEIPKTALLPTTRTQATHYKIAAVEALGVSLFSRVTPREAYEPGVALDLAKVRRASALTALPQEAARQLFLAAFQTPLGVGPPLMRQSHVKSKEELRAVGVYFTRGVNPLLLRDVSRFMWRVVGEGEPLMPGGAIAGPLMREFTNLLERGLRIRVTPSTESFLAIHSAVKEAAIPGVSFPRGEYARGITRPQPDPKPTLTVKFENPFRVAMLPEQRKVLRDLTRYSRIFLRRLGLKVDLRVLPATNQVMDDIFGFPGDATDALFHRKLWDVEDAAAIAMNLDKSFRVGTQMLDHTKMVSDFGHEAGHLIFRTKWLTAPFALQEQLIVLAERLGLGARTASKMRAYAQMQDIVSFSRYGQGKMYPLAHDPHFMDYFTQFEEIMAKEMARLTTSMLYHSGRKARGWLASAKRDLTVMFSTLREYDPDYFEPREALLDFIEHLLKAEQPRDLGLAEDHAAKMQKSMRPSGSLALPGVEHPETGATQMGREMAQRVFSGPSGGGGPPDFWRGFNIAARAADGLNWLAKKTLAVNEIAQSNRVRLPEMSFYVDEARQFNAFINGLASSKHEPRLKEINKLDQTNGDKLARLLFYMTQMEYRTPIEKQRNVVRHPTRQEFAVVLRRFGIDQATLNVYLNIRRDFDEFLTMTEEVAVDRARRDLARNPVALQQKLLEIAAGFAHQRNSPYFPMTRFGDYYLYVKDTSGAIVYADNFTTPEERDGFAPRVRRQYPAAQGFTVTTDMKIDEELRPFAGQPARTLEIIRDRLNINPQSPLGQQFEVLMYELGPERSFKKHWLPREGVAGYSADIKRVYSDYFMHGNRHLARSKFEHRLQDQVNAIREARNRFRNSREKDQINSLADFTQGHLNDLMNPAEDYARLRGFMYFQTLAFAPYTALVQLSQLMFGWSHLVAAYGPLMGSKESAKGLGRAAVNVRNIFTNMAYDVNPIKRAAREQAYSQGVLRDGLAAEMANVATGSIMSRYTASTRIGRAAGWMNFWGGTMISSVDNFGRHVVFDAAYDLAGKDQRWIDEVLAEFPDYRMWYNRTRLEQPSWTEVQAKQFIAGVHATNSTFFETGRWAKPEILRGKWGVIFFLYTITRQLLHFLATAKGGFVALATLWAAAGTMGLPFAEDLNNIIRNAVGLVLGKDWSPERAMRTHLVNTFGSKSVVPEIAMHGLASQVGMHRSISLGRIIPGLADFDLRSGLRPEEAVGEVGMGGSGVLGSLIMNWVRFLGYSPYAFSDPKRWELIAPRGLVRSPMRAARHAIEGSERTAKGAKMPGTEFDWTDPGDALTLILEAASFQPARIRKEQEYQGQFIESKEFYNSQRTALRGKLNQALDSSDSRSIDEALAAIGTFNKQVADQGYAELGIDGKSIYSSYKLHVGGVGAAEAGVPVEKMFVPLSQDLRRVYGVEVDTISKKKVK